jgi:hypothetical protein
MHNRRRIVAKNKVGIQGVAGVGRVAGEERAAQHIGIEVPFVATSHVSVETEVIRAPFSELGIAERFVADPAFYRNLAVFVASEIRRQADGTDSQGNLGATTKSQLTELADGFQAIATGLTTSNGILTLQAASLVASLVTNLRATYAAIMESYPALLDLASIGLAAYAFHQFGFADPTLSPLISAAVVKKEKLADVISAWLPNKK